MNLSQTFGVKVSFEFSQAQQDKQDEALVDMVNERARVQKLTNRELVTEALHADDTDTPVINEMMDRLDPGWYERSDEV